jgi:uncharacterized protein YceK
MNITTSNHRVLLGLVLLALLSGCSTIISSATGGFASALSSGILNQNDLETVRDGAPAYLLLVDGFISENPENEALLIAGAELYGAYAGAFVDSAERSRRLAGRAKDYGQRALCQRSEALCLAIGQRHEEFVAALESVAVDDLEALYSFASSWATWIQLHSGDWNAIADLPKVESAMERVVTLDPHFRDGWPQLYLGVLNTQLPPAYGGKPERGRAYFEEALIRSDRQNLMVYVLFAQQYARLVFDQALHDRLLEEALLRESSAPGLTLINTLAKKRAQLLLAESGEFF